TSLHAASGLAPGALHESAGTSTFTAALPPEIVSTAHRAVETALEVADRFTAQDRHTVNLQFSVAGQDLAVRVELRADEVRTTFRTDSPELRNALAHEWQSVAGQGTSERGLRLVTPTF